MPTSAQVATFLNSSGVGSTVAAADVAEFLASAVREFELSTGWRPFLASTSSSYYFDPAEDGQFLRFDAGFATLTAVVVGITATDPTGTTLTANEDYFLVPYLDAGDGETPYVGIRFWRQYRGDPRSVKITGRKGYCTAVPDDAWQAVLVKAASLAYPTIAQTGDPESVREGAVAFTFGSGRSQRDLWNKQYDSAVARYRRVVV